MAHDMSIDNEKGNRLETLFHLYTSFASLHWFWINQGWSFCGIYTQKRNSVHEHNYHMHKLCNFVSCSLNWSSNVNNNGVANPFPFLISMIRQESRMYKMTCVCDVNIFSVHVVQVVGILYTNSWFWHVRWIKFHFTKI